jgi:hypothetical protein
MEFLVKPRVEEDPPIHRQNAGFIEGGQEVTLLTSAGEQNQHSF